jgi:hypothetical protein
MTYSFNFIGKFLSKVKIAVTTLDRSLKYRVSGHEMGAGFGDKSCTYRHNWSILAEARP